MNKMDNCPKCNRELALTGELWANKSVLTLYCFECDKIVFKDIKNGVLKFPIEEKFGSDKVPVQIPNLPRRTKVYICNKEHKFFLEQGMISDKSHGFYRVKLRSLDKKLDNKFIWVPEHWVRVLPRELLREILCNE